MRWKEGLDQASERKKKRMEAGGCQVLHDGRRRI